MIISVPCGMRFVALMDPVVPANVALFIRLVEVQVQVGVIVIVLCLNDIYDSHSNGIRIPFVFTFNFLI